MTEDHVKRLTMLVAAAGLLLGCEATTNAAHGAEAFVDKTAQKIAQNTDDAALTLAVKGALYKADTNLERAVKVGSLKGRVSLSGTVPTAADKARAEQIARSVKDVTDVLNAIDVATP